jgi:hypothetical protein
MNKKTLKEWWNERSKNQKIFIFIGVVVFLGMLGGDKSKSNRDTDNSNNYERPRSNAKICPVCYSEFNHAGYTHVGRKTYCSQRCYVDGGGK